MPRHWELSETGEWRPRDECESGDLPPEKSEPNGFFVGLLVVVGVTGIAFACWAVYQWIVGGGIVIISAP